MSKQEKLAEFLREFSRWFVSDYSHRHVIEAWERYQATPDDPPQPSEMPGSVKRLCELADEVCGDYEIAVDLEIELKAMREAVMGHYGQPLRLEVGKAYADYKGGRHEVVYRSNAAACQFLVVHGPLVATWYFEDGTSDDQGHPILIREVANG